MNKDISQVSSFPPGQFTPDPRPASAPKILANQASIELKLLVRNGEQILLSLIIPVAILLGVSLLPTFSVGIDQALPLTIAIAVMSTCFTGQSISVAFDRRYGALKRIAASGVPTWALIGGKVLAVMAAVALQVIILMIIALLLGWHLAGGNLLFSIIFVFLGIIAFTSLGLLLGGTLRPELVLAVANTLWFFMMAAVIVTVIPISFVHHYQMWLELIPSVALSDGMIDASHGQMNLFALLVLATWSIITSIMASRLFSFTVKDN